MNDKFNSEVSDAIVEWDEVKSANANFLGRVRRNFLYYTTLQDSDVCKNKWLVKLAQLGLDPKVINFIQMYVEGHAGNLSNYIFSPQFYSNNPELYHVAEKLMWLYQEDSSNNAFNTEFNTMILHSCIIRGVLEMKVKRTLNAPLGRIIVENIFPDQILFDPSVKTPNIARDSKKCWKMFRMTFKQILATFDTKKDKLLQYINDLAKSQLNMQEQTMQGKLQDLQGTLVNNQYSIIESYRIIPEKVVIEYDNEAGVQIPAIGGEIGSEGHREAVIQWANENQIQLSANIGTQALTKETLKVFTFLPECGLVLEDREDERQLVGIDGECHLPFYSHSFVSVNGISSGVPDLAIPLQDNINLSELTKSKWKYCVNPGKPFVHPAAHAGDENAMAETLANINDPTVPFVPSEGAPIRADLMGFIQGGTIPPDILRSQSFDITMLPEILRLPTALRGQSERSGESAKLYSMKVTEANVVNKQSIDRVESLQRNLFGDYKKLALQVYGGRNQVEQKGNELRTTKNKKGEQVNINDQGNIGEIPESEIYVKVNKKNTFLNAVKRNEASESLQQMVPSATNGGVRSLLETEVAINMEGLDEQAKAQITEIGQLSLMFNKLNLAHQINQLELLTMQVNAQKQQMMQPQIPGQEVMQQQGQSTPQGQPV